MQYLKRLYCQQLHNSLWTVSIFIIYWLAITFGSLSPITTPNTGIFFGDKILHFVGYATFTFLAWQVVRLPKHFLIASVCLIIYGGVIEIAQVYTGRSFSWLDMVANGLGVATIYWLLYRRSYPTMS